jgi:hypothetical protein
MLASLWNQAAAGCTRGKHATKILPQRYPWHSPCPLQGGLSLMPAVIRIQRLLPHLDQDRKTENPKGFALSHVHRMDEEERT